MSKCAFFYCVGTGYWYKDIASQFVVDLNFVGRWNGNVVFGTPNPDPLRAVIPGLNGRSAVWDLSQPGSDPFPSLLDPDVWDAKIIDFPASFLGGTGFGFSMGAGINYGIDKVRAAIQALPPGTPFGLGGYSQGAAVMSGIYQLGLQPGTTGPLESRRDSFMGATMFGNPRRATNHYGASEGTWIGSWDQGTGISGRGAFPSGGSWRRLSNPEDKWAEYSNPGDIFSANGNSTKATGWSQGIEVFLDLTQSAFIDYLPNLGAILPAVGEAFGYMGVMTRVVDGAGQVGEVGGSGHTSYPLLPLVDSSGNYDATPVVIDGVTYLQSNKDTCFQHALKYLEGLAAETATAPIVLPSTPATHATAGWSSTLIPPAN